MSTKALTYTRQALAATGFAIQHWQAAWKLRPDLWPTAMECSVDLHRTTEAPGALRMQAVLEGLAPTRMQDGTALPAPGPVLILAFSTVRLAERIEEVTGYGVSALAPAESEAPVVPELSAWQRRMAEDIKRERERLERLAAQPLPPEGTANYQMVMRARAQLGMPT